MTRALAEIRARDRTFPICMAAMRAIRGIPAYHIKAHILTHVPAHLMETIEVQCRLEGIL